MNNLKKFKKIYKNFDFVNFAVPIINLLAPIKYSPHQKYDNEYFLVCLIDFVSCGVSWNKYKGTVDHPINGKYLNQIHNKFIRNNVYDEINRQLLNTYLKKGKEDKLKYQSIDSSFIPNKGGSVKNNNHLLSEKVKLKNKIIRKYNKRRPANKKKKKEETFIDYNRYNGRKKYIKISTVTDTFGTPLVSTIISSKQSDNISITETVNKMPVNLNTLKNSKNNRYKQYMLADTFCLCIFIFAKQK